MKIGELARQSGVSRDTLRFYEKCGLIVPGRGPNGYRDYPEDSALIVNFVRTAQRLGFTLAEIASELPQAGSGELTQQRLTEVMREKLVTIDERIAEMRKLRTHLADMIDRACPIATQSRQARSLTGKV